MRRLTHLACRRPSPRLARLVAAALAAAALAGCGDEATGPAGSTGTFSLAPTTYTIFGDEPVRLLPRIVTTAGDTFIPAAVTWSSSDTTVAVVDGGGTVRAVRMGAAWIRAENSAGRDSAHVVVTGFTTLAAGGHHTCGGAGSAGTWCWGTNRFGQLGNDGTFFGPPLPTPQRVISSAAFVALTAGEQSSCGIDAAGAASCWGSLSGDGIRTHPGRVAGDYAFDRLRVDHADQFCGVTLAHAVLCSVFPDFVPGGEANVRDVGVTTERRCALQSTGALYCTGEPLTSFDTATTEPALIGGVPSLAAIAVGGKRTCGLEGDGSAWCWTSDQTGRDAVRVPGGLKFVSLDVDGDAACGATTAGALYCWGSSTTGQLPAGATGATPVLVASVRGAVAADLAASHGCAITRTGAMYCWGTNDAGELGDGTLVSRDVPTLVLRPTP